MEITPKMADNPERLYKTQWRAHYKKGLGSPRIVYGESEEEALRNALAEFRRTHGPIDNWPLNKVVDSVEFIG